MCLLVNPKALRLKPLTFYGSVAIVLAIASSVVSQDPVSPVEFQGAATAREIIQVRGKLDGMTGKIAKIDAGDEGEVFVHLPNTPSNFRFRAEFDSRGLQPGMLVRFNANFGPAGQPIESVKEVEIFQPIQFPGMPKAVKDAMTPGLHSKANKTSASPRTGIAPGAYSVVGNLVTVTPDSWIVVSAGQFPVRAMLSPDHRFRVNTHTFDLVQPGDDISVNGFFDGNDRSRVLADTFTVSSSRVIGEPVEKTKKTRRAPRGARGRSAAAEDNEPGQDNADRDAPR